MNARRRGPGEAPPTGVLPERATFRKALAGLERSLTAGNGAVPAARRSSVAAGDGGSGPLAAYLERVRDEAHAVTDEEVAALRKAGHTDDELFELTVCSAYGAARRQLEAGLAAVAAVYDSE